MDAKATPNGNTNGPGPANPRDSMKSTWRKDRTQWGPWHYLLDILGMHPSDIAREVPKHAKDDSMPSRHTCK